MSPPPVTKFGAIATAVCAAAFLGLTVVTAMAHERPLITGTCAAFALGSVVLTNLQRRVLHDRKTQDAKGAPPP